MGLFIYFVVIALQLHSEYCVLDAVLIAYKHWCPEVRAFVPIVPLRRLRLEEED